MLQVLTDFVTSVEDASFGEELHTALYHAQALLVYAKQALDFVLGEHA